jgi:L-alanine-DL-glutamate epimerase-like enolase superfamily enzyme
LIDTQLVQRNGALVLPRTPGLGFQFDDEAVGRYALGDGKGGWKVLR